MQKITFICNGCGEVTEDNCDYSEVIITGLGEHDNNYDLCYTCWEEFYIHIEKFFSKTQSKKHNCA